MKTILYFGNKLSCHGLNPTTIELLGVILQQEFNVITCSNKKNKFIRLFDMIIIFFSHKKQTDVILIDTYSTSNFCFAVTIGKLAQYFNIPYIPILHGGNLPNRLKRNKSICKNLFGNSAMNITPSAFLYNIFKESGFSKIQIIHNPIEEKLYTPLERTAPQQPKLLWVRSFQKSYNPQMAIKVLSLIKKDYPKASLCMIGGERDDSFIECKQLAQKLGIEKDVIFTGRLTKKEWIEKSKDYNIFINTTTVDNAPLSVVEAMALGLPVISTNVGGMPYMIENNVNGILTENDNAEQMANAVCRIMTNKDLYNFLSKQSIQSGSTYFSSHVLSAWKELINNLK